MYYLFSLSLSVIQYTTENKETCARYVTTSDIYLLLVNLTVCRGCCTDSGQSALWVM